jgi:hypothetical protein
MTRPGHIELTPDERRQMARLMFLHLETHPVRIGQLFGVTASYVRQQWREHLLSDLASDEAAIRSLRERLSKWPRLRRKKGNGTTESSHAKALAGI